MCRYTEWLITQEAFETCWAHSPLRAAARRITIHQVSLLSRRSPPAHRCPQRRWQRVTEGTAMAPQNGPNNHDMSCTEIIQCCIGCFVSLFSQCVNWHTSSFYVYTSVISVNLGCGLLKIFLFGIHKLQG